jgi:hypothetical protein
MLVRPHDAGVDREHPLDPPDGIVFDDHVVEDPVPGAVRGPASEAFMGGFQGP